MTPRFFTMAGLDPAIQLRVAGTLDGRLKAAHGERVCLSTLPIHILALYHAAMTTPLLTAALARKPRRNPRAVQQGGGEGGRKMRPDNYRAQAAKNLAGAPLGNRRAAGRNAQALDRHARLDALVQQACDLADALLAAARERESLAALLRIEASYV